MCRFAVTPVVTRDERIRKSHAVPAETKILTLSVKRLVVHAVECEPVSVSAC